MTKLIPVNNHLLIEPLEHKEFMASERATYQEIGTVIHAGTFIQAGKNVKPGDKVYFDSWLAKKFPKEGSKDEFFWLVKWEDIVGVEYVEETPPMA